MQIITNALALKGHLLSRHPEHSHKQTGQAGTAYLRVLDGNCQSALQGCLVLVASAEHEGVEACVRRWQAVTARTESMSWGQSSKKQAAGHAGGCLVPLTMP